MSSKKSIAQAANAKASLTKYSKDSSKEICRSLLQLAINTIEEKPIKEGALNKLSSQYVGLDVFELYAIILDIIRATMRYPSGPKKTETLKEKVKDSMFPEEVIEDFMNILCDPKRDAMFNKLCYNTYNSKLTHLRWRIDITISSSILSRVLEPSICIQMILNDGKVIVFELTMAKFHYLRYSIAMILKEMENLESKRLLKGVS